MDAARSQSDDGIARRDPPTINKLRPIHHPDRKSRQIIFPAGIEGRHLRGLSADQRAPGLPAPCGDSLHDGFGLGDGELARCKIIQKE